MCHNFMLMIPYVREYSKKVVALISELRVISDDLFCLISIKSVQFNEKLRNAIKKYRSYNLCLKLARAKD